MPSTELDTVRELPPADRVRRLREYLDRGEARLRDARLLRDQTIGELRAQGLSRRDVAERAGVSVAHVAAVTGSQARL